MCTFSPYKADCVWDRNGVPAAEGGVYPEDVATTVCKSIGFKLLIIQAQTRTIALDLRFCRSIFKFHYGHCYCDWSSEEGSGISLASVREVVVHASRGCAVQGENCDLCFIWRILQAPCWTYECYFRQLHCKAIFGSSKDATFIWDLEASSLDPEVQIFHRHRIESWHSIGLSEVRKWVMDTDLKG
ncbi:hypothetical protein ARMGADRAFT_1026421 [Armillaria gallica]|uniref:Uncharacterized protein n=1 Tax=Armillaria gallica TaxID=47427 RepID=A0A2H3DWH6_ARMGA|nr:hypothetical protein ARMGADRAFT_1026421 [Armillaria gallica]